MNVNGHEVSLRRPDNRKSERNQDPKETALGAFRSAGIVAVIAQGVLYRGDDFEVMRLIVKSIAVEAVEEVVWGNAVAFIMSMIKRRM